MSYQPCGCDPGAGWVCQHHSLNGDLTGGGSTSRTVTAGTVNRSTAIGLPSAPKERKTYPLYSGCLMYFPDALAEVAHVSFVGNEQHNPGEPLHWDRSKSTDEADALTRHLVDAGKFDTDGLRHSAKVAWRALALLQKELERENQAAPQQQGPSPNPPRKNAYSSSSHS